MRGVPPERVRHQPWFTARNSGPLKLPANDGIDGVMPLTKEGAMPKETFWDSATAVEGDDSEPILTVTWGNDQPTVHLNGIEFDRSGINRLIRALVRARNATYGADE